MRRNYDIFEKLEDGSVLWRECVPDVEGARAKLREIAKISDHECCAIDLQTQVVVARVNGRESSANESRGAGARCTFVRTIGETATVNQSTPA
jgi:hypothetical protein